MAHRHALEGLRGQTVGREAERADIGGHVGDAQRSRQVAEELEEPRPVGPFFHVPVLLRGEARGDEVLGDTGLVDGGDGAVARAGERPGALDHFDARSPRSRFANAQARRAERGGMRRAAPRSRPPSGRDRSSVLLPLPPPRAGVIRSVFGPSIEFAINSLSIRETTQRKDTIITQCLGA